MTRRWVLAMDFGTSNTVVAARADDSVPELIEVGGVRRVPSVIFIDDDDIVVGRVAEDMAASRPEAVLRAPKNRLGDAAPVVLAGKPRPVPPLVASLFRLGLGAAVEHMGSQPSEVRLTHPATWTRSRIVRLAEAAALAGIEDPLFISEPVAAALATWRRGDLAIGDYVAVYDLGGGTFDTAIVRVVEDGFELVGRPGGDPSIGGEMLDEVMFQLIGERLDPESWDQIQLAEDPQWMRARALLGNESRRAKETLSAHPWAEVTVTLPSGFRTIRIERHEFETAIAPYIEDTVLILGRCIADAGLAPENLAAIQLAGGASNAPLVERMLAEAFPSVPTRRRGDPKASVALGAAGAPDGAAVPLSSAGRDGVPSPQAAAPAAPPRREPPPPPAESPPAPNTATVVNIVSLRPVVPNAPAVPAAPTASGPAGTVVAGVAPQAPVAPAAAPAPPASPTPEPTAPRPGDGLPAASAMFSGSVENPRASRPTDSGTGEIARPRKMQREKVERDAKQARDHLSNTLGRMEESQRRPETSKDARAHLRQALAGMSGSEEHPTDHTGPADDTATAPSATASETEQSGATDDRGATNESAAEPRRGRRLFRKG